VTARLLTLLAVIALSASGQTGVFGPVSSHPQAGDLAPDIHYTEVLSAPTATQWNPSSLFGRLTVLVFFPDVSDNPEAAMKWNSLIGQLDGKPVQFVLITGEKEAWLLPALARHPFKGFVLLDRSGLTGAAFGMQHPESVIIGTDGRIIGFRGAFLPNADVINAALEGRITLGPLQPGTPEAEAFSKSHNMVLERQAREWPTAASLRPDFPPSYTLHVSPSLRSRQEGTNQFGSDDFLTLQGFDIEDAISLLYNLNRVRIELPASFDQTDRYDFSMVLPKPEGREQMEERFRQGIQDYFHLAATRENRLVDVYVVTSTGQKPPAAKSPAFGGSASSLRVESGGPDENGQRTKYTGHSIAAVRGISLEGTIDQFCKTLEQDLDRPVVNETNLNGRFTLTVQATDGKKNDFLDRLRDQLGLSVTQEQRNVEILVFDPR